MQVWVLFSSTSVILINAVLIVLELITLACHKRQSSESLVNNRSCSGTEAATHVIHLLVGVILSIVALLVVSDSDIDIRVLSSMDMLAYWLCLLSICLSMHAMTAEEDIGELEFTIMSTAHVWILFGLISICTSVQFIVPIATGYHSDTLVSISVLLCANIIVMFLYIMVYKDYYGAKQRDSSKNSNGGNQTKLLHTIRCSYQLHAVVVMCMILGTSIMLMVLIDHWPSKSTSDLMIRPVIWTCMRICSELIVIHQTCARYDGCCVRKTGCCKF